MKLEEVRSQIDKANIGIQTAIVKTDITLHGISTGLKSDNILLTLRLSGQARELEDIVTGVTPRSGFVHAKSIVGELNNLTGSNFSRDGDVITAVVSKADADKLLGNIARNKDELANLASRAVNKPPERSYSDVTTPDDFTNLQSGLAHVVNVAEKPVGPPQVE